MSTIPSWDEYFMRIALLTATRSKDLNTKVGAVLVDTRNRIVGTGYNGFPSGAPDDIFPTAREGALYDTKYAYTIHAEVNALLNSTVYDLNGATLYCTLFPCNECAKMLIQKGVKRMVYLEDLYPNAPHHIASRRLMDAMKIPYEEFPISKKEILS